MRKWLNVELDRGKESEDFKKFLKEHGIRYEVSGAYNMVHFEFKLNPQEQKMVDEYLETL